MSDRETWLSVAPPLPLTAHLKRPRRDLPFPLQEENHRVFARARHGLYRGLQGLGLSAGDEVLVPAYHHGSEIETLHRAGFGWRFYDCDDRLAPREHDLDTLVGPNTRALYLIHYFGLPQDARRWRAWCDERNLLLLEDAAQSWLATQDGKPVGAYGELAIYCLHKSFGLPDGGALVSRSAAAAPGTSRGLGAQRVLARHGEWLAQRTVLARRLREAERFAHREPELPERAFALGDPDSAPLAMTSFLLPRISDPAAAERRRGNFERLLERLGEHVPPAFRSTPPGSAPYVFLVCTPDKDEVLEGLAAKRILGGRLWETPHPSLEVGAFPTAAALRSALVGLPVHQELRPRDLDRIASVYLRLARVSRSIGRSR
jgi:dTDP-4-amino-4,6-dideoxygalactose transaminase